MDQDITVNIIETLFSIIIIECIFQAQDIPIY